MRNGIAHKYGFIRVSFCTYNGNPQHQTSNEQISSPCTGKQTSNEKENDSQRKGLADPTDVKTRHGGQVVVRNVYSKYTK